MNYFYKVYGLNIKSEIEIPELCRLEVIEDDNIHVSINFNRMSEDIKKLIKDGIEADYKKQRSWFNIDNLATYYIENGNKVIIEPCTKIDEQLLKVYILGSVLGIVLLQRNTVAIHGGALQINKLGCVITGDKGAGKSTLTTALRKKGYGFVADDVAAIYHDKTNMINPGFPYQKLCEDTMDKLGYDKSKYTPHRGDMNIKYIVPALGSFIDKPIPLNTVIELEQGDVSKVEMCEIKGTEKLSNLIKNIFRIEVIMYSGGMEPAYLKKCLQIAQNIKYYKITRPENQFTVNEQIEIIENLLFENTSLKKLG
ncbi:hypothetical protein [Romboutsia sp.]|uniref:hypothetical protein n=1 Tax=Romboutsia sp. TaxID=1965302 RepID=UPI003F3E3F89